MQNDMIIINDYCTHCNIEPEFVLKLGEGGLINVEIIDKISYFPASQLSELERYTHLYYDLSINIEGIDAIRHLLQRIENLQERVRILENELHFYQQH
ncbi:MAG TPA: chaperone modulator CbpM [Candidatus Phocaeicola gallistercoris]|nr:chaperone modulator CbpM [Candidatus Phocaeicola gallistercoris]